MAKKIFGKKGSYVRPKDDSLIFFLLLAKTSFFLSFLLLFCSRLTVVIRFFLLWSVFARARSKADLKEKEKNSLGGVLCRRALREPTYDDYCFKRKKPSKTDSSERWESRYSFVFLREREDVEKSGDWMEQQQNFATVFVGKKKRRRKNNLLFEKNPSPIIVSSFCAR